MAAKHPDFVMGFISVRPSQWKTEWSKGLVQMTPGVQLGGGGDGLGQQYNTPDRVIKVRLITPVAPVTLCNTRQTSSYLSPTSTALLRLHQTPLRVLCAVGPWRFRSA